MVEKELAAKLGSTRFVSATYRIFKPSSNPSKEKVKVTYNGEIPEVDTFQLAQNYQLKKNEARALPIEISADLRASRLVLFWFQRVKTFKICEILHIRKERLRSVSRTASESV